MSKAILIFFISFTANIHAQRDDVLISLPYMNILYTGFDNLVKLSFEKKRIKNITLECEGCDTIRQINPSENEWLIRVDTITNVTLIVRNKKRKIIKTEELKVIPPPTPIVYLDTLNPQSTLTEIPEIVSLRFEASVPLSMRFLVKTWSIGIGSKKFSGSGNNISKDVKDYLKSEKMGIILISIKYMSAFGNEAIKEIFEFRIE